MTEMGDYSLYHCGHCLAPTTTTTSRTTTTSTSATSTSSTDTISPASTSQTSGSMVVYCDSNFLWLRLCVDMFRFSHFSFRIQYGVGRDWWSCGSRCCDCDCVRCCHWSRRRKQRKMRASLLTSKTSNLQSMDWRMDDTLNDYYYD